mmetsp:Transcript_6311/g.9238  ORF Transcript_6311/g.9238 Transcript_6311/m.9238 type:complete len:103 (+) Transcript_6311:264-572(+)
MWAEDDSPPLTIWSRVPSRGQNHMFYYVCIMFQFLMDGWMLCFYLELYRSLVLICSATHTTDPHDPSTSLQNNNRIERNNEATTIYYSLVPSAFDAMVKEDR